MTNHQMKSGMPRRGEQQGQTLVEFALILPVLLLLMMAIVDFGRLFFTYSQASNALRESLRYGAITGLNQTSPQYLHCQIIGGLAADQTRVFFADQIDTTIIYTDNENDATVITTYDMAADTGCPTINQISVGDRMTVHNEISVDLVTPIMSQFVPTLTFTMEGTRTLTGGGVSYGVGINSVDKPTTFSATCDETSSDIQEHHPVMYWDTSTNTNLVEFWIYKDSTRINILTPATADGYGGAGISGCGGNPGTSTSCYEDADPYNLSSSFTFEPHEFYVVAIGENSVGLSSDRVTMICPSSIPPDAVGAVTVNTKTCAFGEPVLSLSWTYPNGEAANDVVEYNIYNDFTSTLVATIPATATSDTAESCTDCDPTWDGSASTTTYSVKAVNSVTQESSAATTATIGACTPLDKLYLQNTTTDDSGGTVPANSSGLTNTAMNIACDPTASDNLTINVNGTTPALYEDYAFWTQAFDGSVPINASSPAGATLQIFHSTNPALLAGNSYSFNVSLQHCTTTNLADCTTKGTGLAQLVLGRDTSDVQKRHIEANINIPSGFTVGAGEYLRLFMDYASYTGTFPIKNLTVATGSNTATPTCASGDPAMSWLDLP